MAIQDTLKSMGLEEKEASTYLALLELGEGTILEISRKSGIKRPTTYVVLRALEEKGFVSRVLKGKKTLYSPQHPRKLVTEAELRLKELQEVVPQLESLVQKGSSKPRVLIYEGKDKLDQAYDEMFITKGEVLFIGNISLSKEGFPKSFRKFEYKSTSMEFRVREIAVDDPVGRSYAKEVSGPYHEVRFLPPDFKPFENDMGVYGNRVLISSLKREYFVVVIESEEIAQSFRTMFELMWQAAIPFKPEA